MQCESSHWLSMLCIVGGVYSFQTPDIFFLPSCPSVNVHLSAGNNAFYNTVIEQYIYIYTHI